MTSAVYSPSEVGRTTHQYIDHTDSFSFGAGKAHGINETCRACKSTDTQQIRDEAELAPFKSYFTSSEFRAYECQSCGYKFSWYKPKES